MGGPLRVGRLGTAGPPVDVTPVAVALVVMAGCFAGLATRRAELAGGDAVPASEPTVSVALSVVAGIAVAMLVALSLVVHVGGHLLAARRLGVPVGRLEVSAAGGLTWLLPGASSPQVRRIAAAGPLATGCLVTAAGAIALVTAGPTTAAGAVFDETARWTLRANVLVLAVNLLPLGRLDAAALWLTRPAGVR